MSVLSRLGLRLTAQLSSSLRLRGFGSAAGAQLDYDCYYDEEEEENESRRMVMAEYNGWEAVGRGIQWVIMGDPTVRRHIYAHRLANLLGVPHISMGSLLRQELDPRSPLYKQIAGAVNQGKLVPEDVIFGLLSKRLEEGYRQGETGFILDGVPRSRMQAEILDQITEIDLVLNLKRTEEPLSNKNTAGNAVCSREIHPGFNFSVQPHQTGRFQIPSTNPDAICEEKLRFYVEQRKPLEEYYRQQKKLLDVQVSGGSGDAWQGLLAALHLQHISSHKLTA
ncbi:probable adenylate kinase 7, mitochondrial [Andrographis paniculata]|uniref:probable adenylate kinase 7, mitochondrial n=1 Tax=Andrographis paniculata TaxID=175694 RepID=UPI0021E81109|nr:probable adenylate kinase 7, mitochondrial [Andrographis paniculata]